MLYTVTKRFGEPVTFESKFDNASALAILEGLSSTFAQDLVRKAPALSVNQWAWVHKLAVDATQPKPEPVNAAFVGLVASFAKATTEGKLKRPAITFRIGDMTIRIKRAGPGSRYHGDLMVTDDRPFGANKYFGRVDQAGQFVPGRDSSPAVVDQLTALDKNPAKAMGDYGKLVGNCAMCDRALTDERSLAVGYGGTCAKKWNLPWGATPVRKARELATV